jgi:predicted RNase H-like HicB family nuclease
VTFDGEVEQASDGRWIAEVRGFPEVLAYGESREDALANARVLATRALAECLDDGDTAM